MILHDILQLLITLLHGTAMEWTRCGLRINLACYFIVRLLYLINLNKIKLMYHAILKTNISEEDNFNATDVTGLKKREHFYFFHLFFLLSQMCPHACKSMVISIRALFIFRGCGGYQTDTLTASHFSLLFKNSMSLRVR